MHFLIQSYLFCLFMALLMLSEYFLSYRYENAQVCLIILSLKLFILIPVHFFKAKQIVRIVAVLSCLI